jgi:hypothetical protein
MRNDEAWRVWQLNIERSEGQPQAGPAHDLPFRSHQTPSFQQNLPLQPFCCYTKITLTPDTLPAPTTPSPPICSRPTPLILSRLRGNLSHSSFERSPICTSRAPHTPNPNACFPSTNTSARLFTIRPRTVSRRNLQFAYPGHSYAFSTPLLLLARTVLRSLVVELQPAVHSIAPLGRGHILW